MDKELLKNKLFYFGSLAAMCLVLVGVAYMFFLREIDVDVMTNAQFQYTGENGIAKLKVVNRSDDINQRTREFLNSVQYEVTPNKNLSNGDTVHVKATYDEDIANQYHFKAVNTEADFVVEGLKNRYSSISEIDTSYLETIQKEAMKYVQKHEQDIYQLDPESKEATLEQVEVVYSAFLKSKTDKTSDRFLQVMKLDYLEEQDILKSIIYIVCVPEINDGNKVNKQAIYGERAYLSDQEIQDQNYVGYISRVFSKQYDIEEYIQNINEPMDEENEIAPVE